MKNGHYAVAAMAFAFAFAEPAFAQDEAAATEEGGGWSVTVTPRFQQLYYKPAESDDFEALPSYGGSIAVRTPGGQFGVMATYMKGSTDGRYVINDAYSLGGVPTDAPYDYAASREEIQLTGEYSPRSGNVTLLLGYHRIKASNDETLVAGAVPGATEFNRLRFKLDAVEVGMRLSAALGTNSRHSVSTQFTLGVGDGRIRGFESGNFGSAYNDPINDSGTGFVADFAIGYNYFITDNIAIGARGRAYVFYVDVDDADPIYAVAPELNLTVRF